MGWRNFLNIRKVKTMRYLLVFLFGLACGIGYISFTVIRHFTSSSQVLNDDTRIVWNSQYQITAFASTDVPEAESIKGKLHDEFATAFPSINEFWVDNITATQCVAYANPYSKIYASESTIILYDSSSLRELSEDCGGVEFNISPWYTRANEIYENENITQTMILSKIVNERSNSINVNQITIAQWNTYTGQAKIVPIADSTVYQSDSFVYANIDVAESAYLKYDVTSFILSNRYNDSRSTTGVPVYKFRGQDVSPNQGFSLIGPAAGTGFSYEFNSATGVFTFNHVGNLSEFPGAIYVIEATHAAGAKLYRSRWTIYIHDIKKYSTDPKDMPIGRISTSSSSIGFDAYNHYYDFAPDYRSIVINGSYFTTSTLLPSSLKVCAATRLSVIELEIKVSSMFYTYGTIKVYVDADGNLSAFGKTYLSLGGTPFSSFAVNLSNIDNDLCIQFFQSSVAGTDISNALFPINVSVFGMNVTGIDPLWSPNDMPPSVISNFNISNLNTL